ncbi:hypothetical protein QUF82_14880 [Thiotrichales bacterium HSG14]|nr:hypothetical protein [Thiotrichales bacterium HSG14]
MTRTQLKVIAKTCLKDSQMLFAAKRYDAATALCGYAIELVLKERVCRTLGWTDFPETNGEFFQKAFDIPENSVKLKRFCKSFNIPKDELTEFHRKCFKNHRFLRVNNLETLLVLSGIAEKMQQRFFIEWSIIKKWNPQNRYKKMGSETWNSTELMLSSVETLFKDL